MTSVPHSHTRQSDPPPFVQAARLADVYPAAIPDAVHRLEVHFGTASVTVEDATTWLCKVLALRAPHLWQGGK